MTAHNLQLPSYAQKVIDILECAGYETWAVGGWVRDSLLGKAPYDVDICTQAKWQDVEHIFRARDIAVYQTGVLHGTLTVVVENKPIEITTYRIETGYSDKRHPDCVEFVDDVVQDLARRDFTINAMAYHPERGLLDPFAGQSDLAKHCIRAVGNPRRRFNEDALRIMRAVRFACKLGFSIEQQTQQALRELAPNLKNIAHERIAHETTNILCSSRAAWAFSQQKEIMCSAIPELKTLDGFEQKSPYHCYDVYEHTVCVVRAIEALCAGYVPQELMWAALLHDIAKPQCFTRDTFGCGHFFEHPQLSAQMAQTILRDFGIAKNIAQQVVTLVRFHDEMIYDDEVHLCKLIHELESLSHYDGRTMLFKLLVLQQADALGKASPYTEEASKIEAQKNTIRRIIKQQHAIWNVKDLACDGKDIMNICGIAPGPTIKDIQMELLNLVQTKQLENSYEAIKQYLSHRVI